MQVNYRDYADEADYWRITVDLGALAGTYTDLVIPEPYFTGPVNIANQASIRREPRLVIRGFCYTYIAADDTGFDLAQTNAGSAVTAQEVLWESRTHGQGHDTRAWGHHDNLVWPLRSPGELSSPVSAEDFGSRLQARSVGSVTTGTLCVWGTHTMNDYGDKSGATATIQYTSL